MSKKIIWILLFIGIKSTYAQKHFILLPNEIGMEFFSQRTQSTMQSYSHTSYYNAFGLNHGYGLNLKYRINDKWSLNFFYHYTKLMNSYDITQRDPFFGKEDKKRYKPFSLYWKSNEIGIGFKYVFFSKKGNKISFDQSLCTNFGQLVEGHLPIELGDTLTRMIVYQNGKEAELQYMINQVSVRNMGYNFLNGISFEKKLTSKFNLNLDLMYNFGFIPLIGTSIDAVVIEAQKKSFSDYSVTSNNSGFRVQLRINYVLYEN